MPGGGSKACTKCGIEKPVADFGVRSASSDGLSSQCKECVRVRNKRYYLADKGKSSAQRASNYARNTERLRKCHKDHYSLHREAILARQRAHKEANLAAHMERARKWARDNRGKINLYRRVRLTTDRLFRQKEALRGLLRASVTRIGTTKSGRTAEVLGYGPEELAKRMAVQFRAGMSWENYGEWHIDHKIPIAHFVSKGETRPKIINALSNLQPLWAKENLMKSDKHPLESTHEFHPILRPPPRHSSGGPYHP